MKLQRPAASSFFRRRPTLTERVFSSTKLSEAHRASMMASRLTIWPLCSSRSWRILSSFLVSSTRCPAAVSVPWSRFSTAPPQESSRAAGPKS